MADAPAAKKTSDAIAALQAQHEAAHDPHIVAHESAVAGVSTGPVSFLALTPDEKKYNELTRYAIEKKNAGAIGLIHAKEKDFEILEKELQAFEDQKFDAWVSAHIDWGNPAIIETWRKACPGFFERRLKTVGGVVDLQSKVAMLIARGYPTNKEEALLMYKISTGQIEVPKQPAHLLINKPATADVEGKIHHGFLHHVLRRTNLKQGDIQNIAQHYDTRLMFDPSGRAIHETGPTGVDRIYAHAPAQYQDPQLH